MDYDWETYLDSFGFEPAKRERIAKATFQSPVWDERDRGLYEEDVYLKQFQELDPEDAEDIEGDKRYRRHDSQETICGYLGKISEK